MKLFLIILLSIKLNFTFSQEKNKAMESGFDELKGLIEGLGKGDLSIITKGMKGEKKEGDSNTGKQKSNTEIEKKSISKSFREDQKGLSDALNKLSGSDDEALSGLAKSFQGILGTGDEANNPQLKKQQDKYLDILSDSLIDLLTAQFKFLEAFNMKQNIEITKKALEDLKKGKDGQIPIEQLETAIEVSKDNKVMIDEAIASNQTISEESKEIFSSGMEDYGRGTRKMVNVGYASKEYLSNLDGFGMGMFANLEGMLFLVENIPSLTKTFLASTDNLVQYSNNNDIPVPEEISSVQKENAEGSFAEFN